MHEGDCASSWIEEMELDTENKNTIQVVRISERVDEEIV